jgi:hypothetical protein
MKRDLRILIGFEEVKPNAVLKEGERFLKRKKGGGCRRCCYWPLW